MLAYNPKSFVLAFLLQKGYDIWPTLYIQVCRSKLYNWTTWLQPLHSAMKLSETDIVKPRLSLMKFISQPRL